MLKKGIIILSVLIVGSMVGLLARTSPQKNTSSITISVMQVSISNHNYKVILEENSTAKALLDKLPLTLDMGDLNDNEKYTNLSFSLPTKSENVRHIKAGDIMLFGDNCLVIFYKNFTTSYRYTRIGHIENPDNLQKIVGAGNITAKFTK